MKLISKTVFAVYIAILLWLILFKFSADFSTVLNHQSRSLNLIPFADYSRANPGEMINNFIVFIPLGLLLGVNFKQNNFWRKLVFIGLFSLTVEAAQFVFGIGVTDITDVITNTSGGLLGLVLYSLSSRFIHNEKLDQFIVVAGAVLLIIFILLRSLIFQVGHQSAPPLEGRERRLERRQIE